MQLVSESIPADINDDSSWKMVQAQIVMDVARFFHCNSNYEKSFDLSNHLFTKHHLIANFEKYFDDPTARYGLSDQNDYIV